MSDPLSGLAKAASEAPKAAIDMLTGSNDPKTANLGKAVKAVQEGSSEFENEATNAVGNVSNDHSGARTGGTYFD